MMENFSLSLGRSRNTKGQKVGAGNATPKNVSYQHHAKGELCRKVMQHDSHKPSTKTETQPIQKKKWQLKVHHLTKTWKLIWGKKQNPLPLMVTLRRSPAGRISTISTWTKVQFAVELVCVVLNGSEAIYIFPEFRQLERSKRRK